MPVQRITYACSFDGSQQPMRIQQAAGDSPRPLLVWLHTWGGSCEQPAQTAYELAEQLRWHLIQPDFRGPNWTPQACASPAAKQDVEDAIDWAQAQWSVDPDRIYVMGGSGGGHMAMTIAAHCPRRLAAVSAWCGISDIALWHSECDGHEKYANYAQNIEACVGGRPGQSAQIDQDLRARSPRFHITAATGLPLDLNHGVLDGKIGSVPFHHTILAYNALALVQGDEVVSEEEIVQLDTQGRLTQPKDDDTDPDPLYPNRPIHLRRKSGATRLTIFEGGHDLVPAAGIAFLAAHTRGQAPRPIVLIDSSFGKTEEIQK